MSSNAKKITYNIFFGVGGHILLAIIGIIIPRMFISSYGSEVNGFLSSLNQVFTYIILLEAGVGTATVQALYRPVATADREKTNGILAATSHFYNKTGCYYLLCVAILALVYPIVVKSEIPVWQQVIIILIVGSSGSVGYFFSAKYRMLMSADGKTYIYTNSQTVMQLLTSFTKIVMIALGMNIVFIQLAHMLLVVGRSIYIVRYAKKNYPWLDLKVKPDFEAISQKKSVLVHEVSQMVFNHTDVLLLTVLTDLKVVSVYSIYNLIVDNVSILINNIHNGFSFRLGQIYNTDKEKFKIMYESYETCYMALSIALYCITFLFLRPFLILYTAGVKDINYLDKYLPVLFVSIKLLVSCRALAGATISFAGHFKKTQWRSVLEAIINLSVSIGAILYLRRISLMYGMYGALFGTIAALLYRANDMTLYTRLRILKLPVWKTYSKWFVNLICFGIILLLSKAVPIRASNYLTLVLYAIGYSVVTLAVFGALNFLAFRRLIMPAIEYVMQILRGRFSKLFRRDA